MEKTKVRWQTSTEILTCHSFSLNQEDHVLTSFTNYVQETKVTVRNSDREGIESW